MQKLLIFIVLSLIVALGAIFVGMRSGDGTFTALGIVIFVTVTVLVIAIWNHSFRKKRL
ncbi:hypothetical protein ACIO3O_02445 [Streptomyces sp. NPDC087440]|uniref:hypothetical protein n=1 Tax=Streptomyces sp. NPDC087440 TaxID=3365790 RepID=UPI00380B0BAD